MGANSYLFFFSFPTLFYLLIKINMMNEIWKKVDGYPSYEVSTLGRVRSLKFNKVKVLKPFLSGVKGNEYLSVHLYNRKKAKKFKVHRLVAAAFVDNPEHLPSVNHINGNPLDNRAVNLEYVTSRGNSSHGYKTKDTTSQFTGVYRVKNRWLVQIYLDGKRFYLGRFTDEIAAAKAYNEALEKHQLRNKYRNTV